MRRKIPDFYKQDQRNVANNSIRDSYAKFLNENLLKNDFDTGEKFLRSQSLESKYKDYGCSNLGNFIEWLTGCTKPDFW